MTTFFTTTLARVTVVLLVLSAGLENPVAFAQTGSTAMTGDRNRALLDRPLPTASHGGKVQLLPSQPIAESADPVNQQVAAETADGLILTVTIDGTLVTLDSAIPARIPRRLARADRKTGGDSVKATAIADNMPITTVVVPDTVLNASEGEGIIRTKRRQITLVLEADRPIDTVTIQALATGASASLDVRPAYSRICDADRTSKWCSPRAKQPALK